MHKTYRNLSIICILLTIVEFAGCHDSETVKKRIPSPKLTVSNKKNLQHENIHHKKTKMMIPAGLSAVSFTANRSTTIGTIDNPTIDGGIINASGSPMNRDESLKVISPIKEVNIATSETLPEKVGGDNWAKNEKVKEVLDKAIQNGKLEYVVNESSKRGLPASVATIPMVESEYDERAVSSKGAAGAWQIMPSLAQDYQLPHEERFDFKKSTQLALDHLQELYKKFGNWELAFAAYNAGSQRVTNAMKLNPSATTVEDLPLPKETKQYVEKIKSINEILMKT